MKKIHSYSLQELLVVLVIIGILLLIALPNLMPLISKTKSIEAQTQLNHIYSLQKSYFYLHSKYSSDFNELGFEVTESTESNSVNYQFEIVQSNNVGFRAVATAINDFDRDGILNVWEIDENKNLKEVVKD